MYMRKSKPEKTRLPFSPPEAVLLLVSTKNRLLTKRSAASGDENTRARVGPSSGLNTHIPEQRNQSDLNGVEKHQGIPWDGRSLKTDTLQYFVQGVIQIAVSLIIYVL